MRRSSALLATAALAASVLLVPATAARADPTDAVLTLDFDRLAKDRVVKFTLKAQSESAITGVQAKMHYLTPDAEPYATVDLERAEGTGHDGVWTGEFRPDIDARPGLTRVEVVMTREDGATVTRNNGFYDCYTTTVVDFANAPDVIDFDHSKVTMRGKVMVQRYREAAPEPAAGAKVATRSADDSVTTGEDGSFSLTTSGDHAPSVNVPRQGQLCAAFHIASVTVQQQATQITAKMTPATAVAPYTEMTVEGRLVRQSSAGPVPLADAEVRVHVPAEVVDSHPRSVRTSADGTFRTYFKAGRNAGASATVVANYYGTGFLTGSQSDVGTLNVRNIPVLSGFNPGPEPLPYGDGILAHGTLAFQPFYDDDAKLPVYLEFSPDGKTWTVFQSRTLDEPGSFYFNDDKLVKQDGYWRVRYPGNERNAPLISWVDYIDVKYRTYMYNFNASPEPVSKGKTITVKGLLYRFRDTVDPGPGAKISVYFKASGTSTWKWMADTKTGSDGWFRKTFTASKDGTWMAKYPGSSTYIASNAPTDYVDVR
ncbi:hypothetical protein HUT06_00920 [Actinomadura sp. NAK00032]|uniref:hypothetical protein n=1 Tax=Actinomadura sp. NAK00032 TaxID=2742128 RepID=UPI00159295F4|nr:hypothetical protein [Actinomadura sp. NAK00032]QKW32770.1 hypothetical protein HUT06_00920 [Actinomadura sp. NAK00032]